MLFIHIGYHKTGTSWLQNNLFPNIPNVHFPISYSQISEIFVFPNELDFKAGLNKAEIYNNLEHNKLNILSSERLSGNPHSGGYDSKYIAERINYVFPNAKIMIGIREQLDAIVSSYRQYVRMGGVCSFKQYLNPPSRERIPLFDYKHFAYDRLIDTYIKLFGDANIKVVPYEYLKYDIDYYINEILQFMGVEQISNISNISNEIVYKSLSDISITIKRFINRFSSRDSVYPSPIMRVKGMHTACEIILPKLDNMILNTINTNKYKNIAKSQLYGKYKYSNQNLSNIINIDLKNIGYDV